jgi:hypothetical protein
MASRWIGTADWSRSTQQHPQIAQIGRIGNCEGLWAKDELQQQLLNHGDTTTRITANGLGTTDHCGWTPMNYNNG